DRDGPDQGGVSLERTDGLAGRPVPDREVPIQSGGDQVRAVGPEGDGPGALLNGQGGRFLLPPGIPDPHRAVPARGAQVYPVRAGGDVEDCAGVPLDGSQQQAGGDVPEGGLTREAGGGEDLAVAGERQALDNVGIARVGEDASRRAGGGVPEL